MSTTIDEKVVEMRFDNKQFEAGVQTSLSSLDKLKRGLNLDGAAKGLEGVGDAAKKCDMSMLSRSVETVQTKFSALEVMAVTALANITNSAVNAGKRIASALTIQPVMTGFNEYETKMGSIQTIMSNTASKGTTMADVTRVIDELNTYADKTIYNFAEMTRNIGTFTAAGVGLEESAKAIQGIANLAAASGSTSQQASTAMYQLSQALSSGTVKLMDWNSVVNAGMGGEKFQEALKVTAREHGIAVDKLIEKNGSFRESLQEGWISADILNETLNKFTVEGAKAYAKSMMDAGKYTQEQADALIKEAQSMEDAATKVKTFTQLWDTLKESAQSGWGKTWEIVVGDFEEAKELFTEISDTLGSLINNSSDARNNVLFEGLTSGWKQLLNQGIADGEGFRQTVLDIASEHGIAVDKMRDDTALFNQSLKDGWLSSDILSESIDTFASKVSKMSEEELKASGYTAEQVEQLVALNEAAKNGSVSMEEFSGKISKMSGRENLIEALRNSFQGIMNIVTTVSDAFHELFPPATAEQLYSFTEGLKNASERFKELFSVVRNENGNIVEMSDTLANIKSTFKGLFAVLDIVRQAFSAVFNAIRPLFGGVGSLSGGILGLTASFGDCLVKLNDAIKKGDIFNKVCQSIAGFVKAAADKVKEFVEAIKGLSLFDGIGARVQERMSQISKAAGGMGSGVGASIGAMGSALANSKVFQALQKLWDGVKTITGAIIGAFGDLASGIVAKIGNADFTGALDLLNGISFGAIAIGINKFLKGISKSFDDIGGMFENVKGILDGVRGCFEAYQTQLKAGALLKIAGAIGILAAAIVVISLIDSEKLTNSLGAVTVLFADLMGSMAIFTKLSGSMNGVVKACASMIAVSTAVLILASALKKVGQLDPKQLAVGMVGIVGLTATVVAAAKALGNSSGKVMKGATQMLIFAAAIKVLAGVCTDLSSLTWSEMTKGLAGVGVLLTEVSIFMRTAKFDGKAVRTATGILVLSAAMKVLASACKDLGGMSWSELAKGLTSIGALLLEITAFTKLTGNAKHVISTGLALIEIGAAMKIFASAMSDFGNMRWDEIAKGLVAMGGALAEVAIAMKLMPKKMVSTGTGLVVVGAALEILANALGKMGNMSWEGIAKGLAAMGGALVELSIGLNLMNGTLAGSAAMLVAAGALAILTPVLLALGNMSWESIAKGLVTIAGAFTVIGVAGAVLTPLIGTILGLGAAFTLIGVGVVGIGAGLMLAGVGLSAIAVGITALATSLGGGVTIIVAGLTAIITGIAALIPAIAQKLGEAVIAFCQVITNGVPAIGEAVKAVVLTLVDVLVECVPAIADGALSLLAGVLAALVTYTPQIVDSIMQFLIQVLEGIARNIPQLIQAAVDVLMSFFSGIVSALGSIDPDAMLKGLAGIGLLTAIVAALGAIASLIPAAMAGVLGLGVVIAELAIVLAAVGALAQIPGLDWLIGEGGKLMQTIGTAIGGFVGGIVGGFMSGVSSSFPQIGADLSAFMTNVQPFIDGASKITPDLLSGIANLTGAILLITAADLLEGLTSWLTGGSSLADFGNELVPFGESMVRFSNAISGLDADLVGKAATAGRTLAEMAATLPNSGGVLGFFAGENDMGAFGDQLVGFGSSMMGFAESVKGLDADAVQNAAIAGKAMAEMASTLPNSGGVVGFFAGENDMDAFGEQLVPFGKAIKEYSVVVAGLNADAVLNSATAGQAMVELANSLPNTGGVVAFFTGDNDIATFGEQLVVFGTSMKAYAESVSGLDAESVTASATAGAALVELANTVPNTGGLVSFFTGDNDLTTFGNQIVPFGEAMMNYSNAVSGMNTEAVTASTTAAQALSELQASLPNVGGVVEFFTGGNDLGKFAEGIVPFGEAMKAYGLAVAGMDTEAVTASATAAQALASLQANLPNVGGIVEFFTGGNDLSTFAEGLIPFGNAMKAYGAAVVGLDAEAITASATAAKSLAELQAVLPNVGGVVEFFTGGNDLGKFAEGIVPFGAAMKSYGNAVAEINTEAIANSAIAAQSLAQLQASLPNVGGVIEFFTGGNDLATFAAGIIPFGRAMKSYASSVSGIDTESVTNSAVAGQSLVELAKTLPNCGGLVSFFTGDKNLAQFGDDIIAFGEDLAAYAEAIKDVQPEVVTASANAAQALSNLAEGLPDSSLFDQWFGGDQTLASFGDDISAFGASMGSYYSQVSDINLSKLSGVITQVWSLVDLAEGVKGVDKNAASNFSSFLSGLANSGVSDFVDVFSNCDQKINGAVVTMLNFVKTSISENKALANPAMAEVVDSLVVVLGKKTTVINTAVTKLMAEFSRTIRSNTTVKSAMSTVLTSTITVINDIKPQFVEAGENVGAGFVNGINSKRNSASTAGRNLGLAALRAAQKALDSHSPSREFIHLGENMGEGLAIGAKNSIVPATQAASTMIGEVLKVSAKGIDAFEEWAEERKYYGELSLKDELAGWENLQKQYKTGSEERIKTDREVYRIQNELVSATYQASIDWIEEEKYYHRLSLKEELEYFEQVQQRYLEGSEERKKADREVYRLKNELMDESYQKSMDWIEREKYYNRMSLSDELAAYKRVRNAATTSAEGREKMDREIYRVEKEIYEAQQQYISDVQRVQSEANQKRLDLEQEYADKVKSINEKLAQDIQSLNDQYQSAVESRTNSLYQAYGLFDEVSKKESVSGDTLMKNLEGQVKEFGEWQDILGQLSSKGVDKELIGELEQMGPSAISEIKALNSMTNSELKKYVDLWSVKHNQARGQAVSELEGLRIETQNKIAQLRVDADRELSEYTAVWQQRMEQVTIDANAELERLRKEFAEKVGLIKKNTEEETKKMAEIAQAILKEAGWDETGKHVVDGLTEGVITEKPTFLDALTQMALEGVQAVKKTLEINSPSRVFRKLGNFTGLGFVKGLNDYAGKSYEAGSDMAKSAKSGLSSTVQTIANLIENGIDTEPTIRPVLDLSDVSRGAEFVGGIFSAQRTMGLATQASLAFTASGGRGRTSVTVNNTDVVQELRSLRGEMSAMTEQICRMKLVLDTGSLVGGIAGPMDDAFGRRQTHRGRGI